MAVILDVALPFFALIYIGYAALRWKLVDNAAVRGLNAFVFWFALPALLVQKVSAAPVDRLLDPAFFVIYYAPSLVIYFAVLDYGRLWRREDIGTAALRSLGATFTNSGYMGVPLLIAAFGAEAALPSVLALTLDNLLSVPLTIALVEASLGSGGVAAAVRSTLRNVARNPLVLSVLAGMLLAVVGLPLPSPVENFAKLLGAAASPCALFALGASLALVPIQGAVGEIGLVTVVKAVVFPLLVLAAGTWVYPVAPDILRASLITAALPTAATVFVLSERYERFPSSSTIVLVTHLVSVVTLSGMLVWFKGG